MIRKEFKENRRALKWAFIEACVEHIGYFEYQMLTDVFGGSKSDCYRVVNAYSQDYPTNLSISQMEGVVSYHAGITFSKVVLKAKADTKRFLEILEELYNVEIL